MAVVEQQESTGSNNTMLDGVGSTNLRIQDDDTDEYNCGRSSGGTAGGSVGDATTDPQLIEIHGVSGGYKLYQDGVDKTGTVYSGSDDLKGLTLGERGDLDGDNLEVDFGAVYVLENHNQNDLESIREIVKEKWNINVSI